MRVTKGAPPRAQSVDLSRGFERITQLVDLAEKGFSAAVESRLPRAIAEGRRLVDEAWACIAFYREEARLHPATEAYVAFEAGRLLSVHKALALLAPASSARIRASARVGPTVTKVRPHVRAAARRPA